MSWDNDLKTTLGSLDVPEHRPEFWGELELRLKKDPDDGRRLRTTRRRWKAPVGLVAAGVAVVVGLTIALPTSLTSTVLAYSYTEGTYTYDISYLEDHHTESIGEGSIEPGSPVSTEAHGTLTYSVEEDPDAGITTIGVQAVVSEVNSSDPDQFFRDIPEVSYVVDSDGGFVRALPMDPNQGFPGLVLPDPLPGSNLYSGLPLGFGPPFPAHPLDVGASWTTSGPRSAFSEDGPQFTAQHRVVRTETIAGRDTIVINSVYQTPAWEVAIGRDGGSISEAFFGPETAEVTVWFDPAAGIIVRAELEHTTTAETRFENGQALTSFGTTQIVVELNAEG